MPQVKFQLVAGGEKTIMNQMGKLQRQIETLNAKNDQLKGKLSDVGKTGKSSFSGLAGELKNVASTLIGPLGVAGAVGAVVMQLKAAYAEMRALNKERIETRRTAGEARAMAIPMLGDFKGGPRELDKIVKRAQAASDLKFNELYGAATSLLSARGDVSEEGFKKAFIESAKVQALTGGGYQAAELGASAMDIAPVTGSESAKGNLGRLLQFGSVSRVTDLNKLINVVPALKTGQQAGFSEEETFEYLAQISKESGDTELRKSRTGLINFVKSIQEKDLVPTTTEELNRQTGRTETKTSWGRVEGATIQEKIKTLQETYQAADEGGQADIMKRLGGEAQMNAFFRQFLGGDEEFEKRFAQTKRVIKPFQVEKAEKEYDDMIQRMGSGKLARAAATERGITGGAERQRVSKAQDANVTFEQAVNAYERTRAEAGGMGMATKLSSWGMQFESINPLMAGTGVNTKDLILDRAQKTRQAILETKDMSEEERLGYFSKNREMMHGDVELFRGNIQALNDLIKTLNGGIERAAQANEKAAEAMRKAADANADNAKKAEAAPPANQNQDLPE